MRSATLTAQVAATPEDVFATLVDPGRLPTWNTAIRRVLDAPAALTEGAEWVVEMHAFGRSWKSRSRVVHVDSAARTFRYQSRTDDGNPSSVDWSWEVRPNGTGASAVTVSWQLNPKTFWRRVLFARIRQRQLLRGELPASLRALDAAAHAATIRTEDLVAEGGA